MHMPNIKHVVLSVVWVMLNYVRRWGTALQPPPRSPPSRRLLCGLVGGRADPYAGLPLHDWPEILRQVRKQGVDLPLGTDRHAEWCAHSLV